jgi:hypothetical protein
MNERTSAMKAEAIVSTEASEVETPSSKAGRFLALHVEWTIDMVDTLSQELQEIDNLDSSAFTGFGMLVSARLRAALNEYQKRLQRADA